MLKKTLAATAIAGTLTITAVATAAPAAAQTVTATTTQIGTPGGYVDVGGGKPYGNWQSHGPKYNAQPKYNSQHWQRRRACSPIVRWRQIGHGYHKRWTRVVVGWNCHRRPFRPWYWH